MQETWVRSLDPLEKEMATHSSILAWRIPWTEEPGGLQCVESQKGVSDEAHRPVFSALHICTWFVCLTYHYLIHIAAFFRYLTEYV